MQRLYPGQGAGCPVALVGRVGFLGREGGGKAGSCLALTPSYYSL